MSTSLDNAILNMVLWRGDATRQCMAFLLLKAKTGIDVSGADLPGELTGGSKNLPGIVVKILLQSELVKCVGYEKSPRENAHGRRVAMLRIKNLATVNSWLARNGYVDAEPAQLSLAV